MTVNTWLPLRPQARDSAAAMSCPTDRHGGQSSSSTTKRTELRDIIDGVLFPPLVYVYTDSEWSPVDPKFSYADILYRMHARRESKGDKTIVEFLVNIDNHNERHFFDMFEIETNRIDKFAQF